MQKIPRGTSTKTARFVAASISDRRKAVRMSNQASNHNIAAAMEAVIVTRIDLRKRNQAVSKNTADSAISSPTQTVRQLFAISTWWREDERLTI